jgi:putative transposase
MSRPLRIEYPGSLHHATSRGNAQQNIFLDDTDRELFLGLLGKCVERFCWILTAYVLMSNHFHFVIQLTEETLSLGMQWLNGEYARRFNRRHKRVGHLFQGRPHLPLVEKETYGFEVLRYVVLNPVRAGMVSRPEDYAWSSHRAVIGQAPAPDWLAVDDVLMQFGSERVLAQAAYRDFVNAALGKEMTLWRHLVGQMYLGSENWMERVRERVDLKPRASEHPRSQRLVGQPSMTRIIRAVADTLLIDEARIRGGRGGIPRMMTAWVAWNDGHLTTSEIAAGLRLECAAYVTRLVKRCDRELRDDAILRDCVDRCLSTIGRKKSEVQT